MKKILLSAAALALLATSCKKDDDNNNTPSNGFTLNGTQYNTTNTNYSGNILTAYSTSPTGSVSLGFNGNPAAGDYTIASSASSNNQISISVATTSGTSVTGYAATPSNTNKAKVTVNGSKITVSFTDIWVKNPLSNTDSVKLSGNITQL